MLEPFSFLSGASQAAVSSLQFVEFIIQLTNCPEDVKTCFSLVKRVHDDVHFAIELRTKHRTLLLKRPVEANRVNSIISTSLESLQDVGVLVERVRADANGGRIDIVRRLRWILGDSASFVARTSNLQTQHAAILSEIAYLRTLDMVQPLVDAAEQSTWENVEFLGPSMSMRRTRSWCTLSSADIETSELPNAGRRFRIKRKSLETLVSSQHGREVGPHSRHGNFDTLLESSQAPEPDTQYKYWNPESLVAPKSPELAAREPSAHRILELPAEVVPLHRAISTETVTDTLSLPALSEASVSLHNFMSAETLVNSTFDHEEQTFELAGPPMSRLPGLRFNSRFTDNISFSDTNLDLSLEESLFQDRIQQAAESAPPQGDLEGADTRVSDVSEGNEDHDFEEAFFRDWRMQEQENRSRIIT